MPDDAVYFLGTRGNANTEDSAGRVRRSLPGGKRWAGVAAGRGKPRPYKVFGRGDECADGSRL